MDALASDRSDLGELDVAVIQATRHGQTFVRSMLAGLKVGRIRAYDRAEQALREMRLDPPSVVITDWEMRPRGGYWLVTSMRKAEMDPLCFVPALILTPEISWSMLDVALESGVNSVLLKPISALTLRRRLTSLVHRPQRFVEHLGSFIPEGSKQVLEERMRAHESPDTRAHRMQLREALERMLLDETLLLEERGQLPEIGDEDGPDRLKWEGWNAA